MTSRIILIIGLLLFCLSNAFALPPPLPPNFEFIYSPEFVSGQHYLDLTWGEALVRVCNREKGCTIHTWPCSMHLYGGIILNMEPFEDCTLGYDECQDYKVILESGATEPGEYRNVYIEFAIEPIVGAYGSSTYSVPVRQLVVKEGAELVTFPAFFSSYGATIKNLYLQNRGTAPLIWQIVPKDESLSIDQNYGILETGADESWTKIEVFIDAKKPGFTISAIDIITNAGNKQIPVMIFDPGY